MIYLILAFLLFTLIVILRQKKSPSLIWFLMMPAGFALALCGLMLFTEYIAFANFTENPLFISGNLLVWKVNYYLDLSVFGMYRLMNIGIALYIIGAIGFPLSQHPRADILRKASIAVAVPAALILGSDPELLQWIFRPASMFESMQDVLTGLNIMNRILNFIVKAALVISLLLSLWIHFKTPKVFRKRSKLIILGIAPIHVLVFVLFYWFPSNSIHIWRLATLKMISLPYTNFISSLIVFLSFLSIAVLIYISIVYNSFEMNALRHQIGFKARMHTAGTGLRIFAHSIKNQFIAVKLLSEQQMEKGSEHNHLESIVSICDKSIDRLSSLPILPDKISLEFKSVTIHQLISNLSVEFTDVKFREELPNALVQVDEHYLLEVLRNLIINSREAVREKQSPEISVDCFRQLNYVVIAVNDNGCGIAPNELKHVFEPFYSTKPSISNWGMGLALSQQLIEAFGGTMHAESTLGCSTRIEVYIPEDVDGK